MEFKGNEKDFVNEVSQGTVLVDFYADWCGPCRMLAPVLDEVAEEKKDLKIIKVNVDANPQLAQDYGVLGVPYLILFKNGDPVAQTSGFRPKEALLEWLLEN